MAVPVAAAAVTAPWLAPVAIGAGFLSNLWGNYKMGKLQRKQERALKRREVALDSMFNKEYNEDVLESSTAKSALKRIRESLREGTKRDQNTTAITGGSDEAAVAAKGERFKGLTEAVTSIAESGSNKKERLFSEYWRSKGGINAAQASIDQGKVASRMNLANNVWNTIGSLSKFKSMGSPSGTSGTTPTGSDVLADVNDPQYDAQAEALKQLENGNQ